MKINLPIYIFLILCSTANAGEVRDVWDRASTISGVPVKVIQSICIAESGIAFTDGYRRAWPYTLNSAYGPMHFRTRDEASNVLQKLIDKNLTNIDIGICQVNMTYHKDKATAQQLLDPVNNIIVASTILRGLMKTHNNNLSKVVATYHTGSLDTQERVQRGSKYLNNVSSIQKKL